MASKAVCGASAGDGSAAAEPPVDGTVTRSDALPLLPRPPLLPLAEPVPEPEPCTRAAARAACAVGEPLTSKSSSSVCRSTAGSEYEASPTLDAKLLPPAPPRRRGGVGAGDGVCRDRWWLREAPEAPVIADAATDPKSLPPPDRLPRPWLWPWPWPWPWLWLPTRRCRPASAALSCAVNALLSCFSCSITRVWGKRARRRAGRGTRRRRM